MDSSIRTSLIMLFLRPRAEISSNSRIVLAMPPPVPPSVKLGLIITGRPIFSSTALASSMVWAKPLFGRSIPILSIAFLKSLRSSAFFIALRSAPIIFTPYLSRMPASAAFIAVLRPVCPPSVGRSASGLSFFIIFSRNSGVMGSMYVASAMPGSVMIVAGFELMSTTSNPSSLRALQAWLPE